MSKPPSVRVAVWPSSGWSSTLTCTPSTGEPLRRTTRPRRTRGLQRLDGVGRDALLDRVGAGVEELRRVGDQRDLGVLDGRGLGLGRGGGGRRRAGRGRLELDPPGLAGGGRRRARRPGSWRGPRSCARRRAGWRRPSASCRARRRRRRGGTRTSSRGRSRRTRSWAERCGETSAGALVRVVSERRGGPRGGWSSGRGRRGRGQRQARGAGAGSAGRAAASPAARVTSSAVAARQLLRSELSLTLLAESAQTSSE